MWPGNHVVDVFRCSSPNADSRNLPFHFHLSDWRELVLLDGNLTIAVLTQGSEAQIASISRHLVLNTDRILPLKRLLISILLLLVYLSFSSLKANGQENRYWGTIIRIPPANYVLRMDDGKILNAEWESGYDRWSIGERIILTTENGSGIMFFNKRRTRVAVFPYNPSQIGQ